MNEKKKVQGKKDISQNYSNHLSAVIMSLLRNYNRIE